jgi:hypothetical protein
MRGRIDVQVQVQIANLIPPTRFFGDDKSALGRGRWLPFRFTLNLFALACFKSPSLRFITFPCSGRGDTNATVHLTLTFIYM